jgi:hypothetical protein
LRPGFVTSAALKRRLAGAPHGTQAPGGESSGDGAATPSITTRSRRAATSMRQVRTRKHGSQTAQMNNGK